MSSITLASARQLQADQVRAARIWDTTPQYFTMLPRIPWMPIKGEALVVNRAKKDKDTITGLETRGKGVMIADISANPGTDLDGTEAQAAYDPVDPPTVFYIRRFVGDVLISNFASSVLSGQNPQREFQVDAKLTAMRYAFSSEFITADGNTAASNRITGIDLMIDDMAASQTVATPTTGSRQLTRGIDLLLAAITDGDGQPTFLLMSPDGLTALRDALRASGSSLGQTPDPLTGKMRQSYDGIIIEINTFIPTVLDQTTIYAGILGRDVGLYAIYPEGVGDRGLVLHPVMQHPTADYAIQRITQDWGLGAQGGGCLSKLTDVSTVTGS